MSQLTIGDKKLFTFDLSSKPILEKYLKQLDLDTSDYTFAANYLWMSNGSGFYAIIENSFCLFLLTQGQISMLLPPIGTRDAAISAMKFCFALMEQNNSLPIYTKIDYVDEFLLSGFVDDLEAGAEIFDLLEDYIVERSLIDYVYHSNDLIDLKGNSYSTKRNEINKFMRIHSKYELEILDVKKHAEDITRLVNKWISDRMKYMPVDQTDAFLDGVYSERIAVKRMLTDYDALELIGLVILIGGEVKGFTVGEKINKATASVIIEKTDFEVFGCAQFIFREFAKVLSKEYGIIDINVGDDMGFENLKKVKMSYRPSKLIPKYTIYKRQ